MLPSTVLERCTFFFSFCDQLGDYFPKDEGHPTPYEAVIAFGLLCQKVCLILLQVIYWIHKRYQQEILNLDDL